MPHCWHHDLLQWSKAATQCVQLELGVSLSFRIWLEQLRDVRGARPLWPVLLGAALDAEFQRQRQIDDCYKGEVFKNRDKHLLDDGEREERLVARLYRSALDSDGCVQLKGESIWLLGFQWPTQGSAGEKSRRADLVGITSSGGLVVFEAKRSNGDPPLIAIAEGLDYLSCLMRRQNFNKIVAGFQKWKRTRSFPIPKGFEETVPNSGVRPSLVVLAPEAYFLGRHARGIRGKDWPHLAAVGDSIIPSVRLAFAATDFKSTCLWNTPKSNG